MILQTQDNFRLKLNSATTFSAITSAYWISVPWMNLCCANMDQILLISLKFKHFQHLKMMAAPQHNIWTYSSHVSCSVRGNLDLLTPTIKCSFCWYHTVARSTHKSYKYIFCLFSSGKPWILREQCCDVTSVYGNETRRPRFQIQYPHSPVFVSLFGM